MKKYGIVWWNFPTGSKWTELALVFFVGHTLIRANEWRLQHRCIRDGAGHSVPNEWSVRDRIFGYDTDAVGRTHGGW